MNEMVAATKSKESDSLIYEWFISDDGNHIHIYERYSDTNALLTHLGNFGENFAERFMGVYKIKSFTVFGTVNEAIIEALSPLGAVFYKPYGGFAR